MDQKIILELNQLMDTMNSESIQYHILSALNLCLLKLIKTIEVSKYLIVKDYLSLELNNVITGDYYDIEINSICIEIRWNRIELFEFYDLHSTDFYIQFVSDFFLGNYQIVKCLCYENQKEFFKINWDNKMLGVVNSQGGRFSCSFFEVFESLKGNCLIS